MENTLNSLSDMAHIKPIILSSSIGIIILTIVLLFHLEDKDIVAPPHKFHDLREITPSELSKINTLIKSKKNNQNLSEEDQLLGQFGFTTPTRDQLENHITVEGSINSLIATGLILQDPSFYYHALNIEPNNPHLLLLLGSHENTPPLQKLEFAKKLIQEQPENLVGSYLLASIQFNLNQTNEAIKTLLKTDNQNEFNDFLTNRSLIINETLLQLGNSEIGSALYSTFFTHSPMTYRYNEISKFLINELNKQQQNENLELRKLVAELGTNLVSKRNLLINDLVGLAIQKKSMTGMKEEDLSPFIGLSVKEAHENLIEQKKQIKNLVIPDFEKMRGFSNDTLIEWIEKIKDVGEFEATLWLNKKTINPKN